jgi:hypothetical protein
MRPQASTTFIGHGVRGGLPLAQTDVSIHAVAGMGNIDTLQA